MNHKTIQTVFFLILLVGALVLLFFIVQPFLGALVLAFTLAILFYPLYQRINQGLKDRRGIAALLTILIILIVVLTPLTFLSFQVFNEARGFYFQTIGGSGTGLAEFEAAISRAAEYLPDSLQARVIEASTNISAYAQQGIIWILGHIGSVFSSIARLIFNLFISLIGAYYLFKQGSEFKARLISISPLSDRFDRRILDRLQLAVSSVIRGTLVVAIVQALLAGIGFWIFGVPNPALWGTLAMLAALIPGLGTALVMTPAILYLFLTGHTVAGIGLVIWAVVAVGLIDNFLSPVLVGRGVKIHSFFILLSVLGGLSIFGPVGFLLGPLVLSFFFALLDIYPVLILHEPTLHEHQP